MSIQTSRFKNNIALPQSIQQQSKAIKQQLTKIDSLQEKIKIIQSQLLGLKKQDKLCDKNNLSEIQTTLLTIRNKINISQTHQKVLRRQKQNKTKFQMQKNKVRQLREKQIQDLEKVKQQNKKMKQQAMNQIKKISLLNTKIINQQKQNIIKKNQSKAQKIKKEKESAKNNAIQLKLSQILQKHNCQMEKSRSRLAQQNSLIQKCSILIKNKEDLQKKVQTKKQYALKLQQIYKDIGKMKDQDIQKTIHQIKNKIKDKDSKGQNADEDRLKQQIFQKFILEAQSKNSESQS